MNEKELLMKKLQGIEFAMVDLGLFLDSHSENEEAIKYFKELQCEHEKLVKQYEKCYGPLTMTGSDRCDVWEWVKTPWPWEICQK